MSVAETTCTTKPKIFTTWIFEKKFVDPCLREESFLGGRGGNFAGLSSPFFCLFFLSSSPSSLSYLNFVPFISLFFLATRDMLPLHIKYHLLKPELP